MTEAAAKAVLYIRKGVLRNFAKFTSKQAKHLRQSSLFNKVAGRRPATLLIKILWHRCFPMTPSQDTFSTEHLWVTASVMKTNETHSSFENEHNFRFAEASDC